MCAEYKDENKKAALHKAKSMIKVAMGICKNQGDDAIVHETHTAKDLLRIVLNYCFKVHGAAVTNELEAKCKEEMENL